MAYTIKEIADLAGVTTRTLRYYDEIGLLSPAEVGGNGYRLYDHVSLLRLQQIRYFRELDVPLKKIIQIMRQPEFDLKAALEAHRTSLQGERKRVEALIETLDQTIATLEGEWIMNDKELFNGFDESKYEEEAKQRWGNTPQYKESTRKWADYTKEQKESIKQEMGAIARRMTGVAESKPGDEDIQQAVADYYHFLNHKFYMCNVEFLRNLSDMWVEDPRFAANYERIREGGAAFVRDAVHIYCDRMLTTDAHG
jgi:DNA-binding transcriptional MerR regulator